MVANKKSRFLGTSGLVFVALMLPASAAAQGLDETRGDEPIIVTGSRIVAPETDNPYPVVSYTDEVITQSGHVNLTDLLVETPALLSSTTTSRTAGVNASFGGVGTNLLNLRNLGEQRTLVLVDGRRHVSSVAGQAGVDINTIPLALVERVDVLTGGVSAIYGADGVSGVVNFVMKRDFEGVEVRGQNGISSRGDAEEYYGALTAGHNFASGAGNIAVSYEYRRHERVRGDQRRTGRSEDLYTFHQNLADLADDPNVPDRIPYNNIGYFGVSSLGAIDVNFDRAPEFRGDGQVFDRGLFLPVPGGFAQGGDNTPVAGFAGDLSPFVQTHNANLLGSYEFSPGLRFFGELKYVNAESYTEAQPSGDFGSVLYADNAYLPASVRAAVVPGLLGQLVGAPPGVAFPDGVLVSRSHFDFGRMSERSTRETWRGVAGFDGEIGGNVRYELSYTFGETKNEFVNGNHRIGDRYFAAIDAVDLGGGNIVCRSTVAPQYPNLNLGGRPYTTFTPGPGSPCVPLNILGSNVASEEALAFVLTDLRNFAKLTQHVVSGSISGDFGEAFALPGGPVSFAVGAEYRKEKSRFTPDRLLVEDAILNAAQVNPERGSFDVAEAFAELRLPVLRGVPGAELLQFGGAVRLSDYSTIGTTTTWKLDATYAPIRDLRLRGTYSQSVRAPNITELFAPQTGNAAFIVDPCDITRVNVGTQYRAANCSALLTALGIDPATYNPSSNPAANVAISGAFGGNADLREEKARTWTVGAVVAPRFVPGLVASFDWYDIELKNAINTATAQELADLCVDQPGLDNPFCSGIVRNPDLGRITSFLVTPQNVARFRTAGADLALNYAFQPAPAWGQFNMRFVAGYLDKFSLIASPGAAPTDQRGDIRAPKWSGTFDLNWRLDAFSVNYGVSYFSKTRRFSRAEMAANPDIVAPKYLFLREHWEHDLQLAADAYDGRATFYTGVQNLFDRKPDIGGVNYPVSYRGRFFYFGIRAAIGGN